LSSAVITSSHKYLGIVLMLSLNILPLWSENAQKLFLNAKAGLT